MLWTTCASAQFGNYQSLNAPFGARNAALGGTVVSLADGDIMQFVHNPAVLDSVSAGALALNYSPYFAGIHAFSGAYQADFPALGKIAFGLTYFDYGTFTETTDNGQVIGEFEANDYLISIGKSHQLGSFSLGMNLKYALNGIAGYNSSVILGDLGGIYRAPNTDFTVGLVFKNFGFVVDDFDGRDSQVPFDVQLSTSVKPQHMPFRFSISAYNLTETSLYHQLEGNSDSRAVKVADKIFRRINLGAELIIHQNIQFLFGYSHLRRQELSLVDSAEGAGFSYGFLIGIKKIKIRYAHASYHAAGGTDFFTIQTNLNSFNKIL